MRGDGNLDLHALVIGEADGGVVTRNEVGFVNDVDEAIASVDQLIQRLSNRVPVLETKLVVRKDAGEAKDLLAEREIEQLAETTFPRVSRVNQKRSEEHTSELQSQSNLVCRLLLEKKKNASNRWLRH